MAQDGFWADSRKAQNTIQKLNQLKGEISSLKEMEKEVDDTSVLTELAEDEQDEKMQREIMQSLSEMRGKLTELELEILMSGEFDNRNAILSIHAGAGGTERPKFACVGNLCSGFP